MFDGVNWDTLRNYVDDHHRIYVTPVRDKYFENLLSNVLDDNRIRHTWTLDSKNAGTDLCVHQTENVGISAKSMKLDESIPGDLHTIMGVGPVKAKKLLAAGIKSVEDLKSRTEHEVVTKIGPFGRKVHRNAVSGKVKVLCFQISSYRTGKFQTDEDKLTYIRQVEAGDLSEQQKIDCYFYLSVQPQHDADSVKWHYRLLLIKPWVISANGFDKIGGKNTLGVRMVCHKSMSDQVWYEVPYSLIDNVNVVEVFSYTTAPLSQRPHNSARL